MRPSKEKQNDYNTDNNWPRRYFRNSSIATAIISMMVIGAVSEAISYARNPYLRQRRIKVLQRKASAAFAFV